MSNWIQTFSGLKFDLLDPSAEMITIEDIAHHLSQENRFSGACRFPVSVAYHSINVCNNMPEGLELEGLFHDANKAYYKDLTLPLKRLIRSETLIYDDLCLNFDMILEEKFNLELIKNHKIIKEVDLRMAMTERQTLIDLSEKWSKEYDEVKPFKIKIIRRDWKKVKLEFLELFKKYERNI